MGLSEREWIWVWGSTLCAWCWDVKDMFSNGFITVRSSIYGYLETCENTLIFGIGLLCCCFACGIFVAVVYSNVSLVAF